MIEYETDLKKNLLVRQEELYLIYEGPSFNGKMEMPSLISQLQSTEIIIKEIIKNLYLEKKLPEPENIKIYLKLKRGSFREIIEIILNHPLTISIIGGCMVVLFDRLLKRKEKTKSLVNIEKMINNYLFVKEIDNLTLPLQKEEDRLIIYSPLKKDVKTEVKFKEKEIMKKVLKKLQEEISIEIVKEEFFGYLHQVNIDRETFGFNLEGTNRHIPVTFYKKPELKEIKKILGERVKIKADATYKNNELIKLDIINYKLKERRTLKDFENKV